MSKRTGKEVVAPTIAEKRDLLFTHEQMLANQLARQVIDKPKPPLWMILVPVFFVFFAMKMKEYKTGVKNFARNWMITRDLALDAAYDAVDGGGAPQIDALLSEAKELKQEVLPLYRQWVEGLVEHFSQLLDAEGETIEDLIRNHYRTRSNFQLTLRQLSRLEQEYLQALLPTLPGDQNDLQATIYRIKEINTVLQQQSVDAVFK
ncbi:NF038143 family protein [Desulfogranum japonicum]|uniref:NF038143 family protein n=1 Tax=Desulfogranum japonicum TaxID=231447 RepID=UPI0004017ADF|nr:NF038143 family protein [Desulfogranum japonicum]